MLYGGVVINAEKRSKYLEVAAKLHFVKQKVPLSVVVFLLSTVLVLLVWSGWEQYSEFRKTQIESMQQSSWSAANEISSYVEMMRSNLRMFADNETKLLEEAQLSKSVDAPSIVLLNRKISNRYPDAINFLIWDKEGKLVIDAEGTQVNKPEVYVLPSIGGTNEYAVRMYRNSEHDHFNIVIPWNHGSKFMGVFGLSFPSELVQPLLYKHQNANYQLVLWREDSPGFVELTGPDSNLELVNDVYLEPEDMQRVGVVASISGTEWDVVSMHHQTLFTDKLKNIILNGLLKFLAILASVIIAAKLYQREARRKYEANEKIRKTQERLQLALESTQDGVWEIDLGKDEYYFDERWCELVGYSSEELQADRHSMNRMIHDDDLVKTKQALESHLKGETDFYENEHRLKHKSGEWIWVHDRGRILDWAEDGTPLRVIGITADVTERKRAEIILKQNEEALRSFYSIVTAEDTLFHNQIQCLLVSGCKHLAMKCGIFSYIEGKRYTVMQVHTESPAYKVLAGDKFDLGLTYCQLTIESRETMGFAHAKTTNIVRHPAYEALKLEAYIGATVYLNNKPYGTLNFTSIEPHDEEFYATEKKFVQMMAEWISNKLQSQFAEQRQKEADQTLALHLRNSPTASIKWCSSGVIKRWSCQAEEILGWNKDEVIGKSPKNWPIKHPSHKEALSELQSYMQDDIAASSHFELTINDASGNIKHTEWSAFQSKDLFDTKVSYFALVHDVTERVEMQQKLMRSQIRLHDLYENAPDMYFSVDTNGTILSVNQFCAQYLGYTKDDLLNKPIWNLMHENDIRRARRHINVVFDDQVNETEMEIRMLTRNNIPINTHHRLRLIEAQQDMPCELRILCRDVTKRDSNQQERLNHVKVQRDEVSREMRHRIKNNLQAVVGLLKVNLDAYPELRNVLVTSINQVDTISIVNNLMIDSKHKLVNLVELVKDITQASSKLFSQKASFEVLCDDPKQIKLWEEETMAVSLIISELITNAMKHRAASANDSDGVRIAIRSEKAHLLIEVANVIENGVGEEFDFEQSLNNGGIGLGMMQSLMPPEGAKLEYQQVDNYLRATLILQYPVILNNYTSTSELNELEVVS